MQPFPNPNYYSPSNSYSYSGLTTPSQVYQERLNNLQNQYPQLQQNNAMAPMQQPPAPSAQVRAVAVTSVEEAKVYPISFDSTIYLIYDTSTGIIYRKQFDINTGGALFIPYMSEQQLAEQTQPKPIKEPEKPIEPVAEPPQEDVYMELREEINGLKKEITQLKEEVKKHDEPIPNAAANAANKPSNKSNTPAVTRRSKPKSDAPTDGAE